MSSFGLDRLFSPRSVAVVGSSPRELSTGRHIVRNLRAGGFKGLIHLVNPKYPQLEGAVTVPSLRELRDSPDLIVVTTPALAVPGVIEEAAKIGCAAAIIVTSELGNGPDSLGGLTSQVARPHGLRLVGPNSIGVVAPRAGLNASLVASMPRLGDLALISQSGAIAAAMVAWAGARTIGFSAVVTMGDELDVDVGDLLDFFSVHRGTRAILLYIESINDARKFMSALRAASRTKPVVVIKAGRHPPLAKAAITHTSALAGSDSVYDAALRRSGALRVHGLDELFAAAETLGRVRPIQGKRLAVLTNGGGLGVLAVDRLVDLGGIVASLSDGTAQQLSAALPPTWSRANPVDIGGDADGARYKAVLEWLLADPGNDAVLVMNVPNALGFADESAQAVGTVARQQRSRLVNPKPVLAVWLGQSVQVGEVFDTASIPRFNTESEAVQGFMHLARYRESIEALMETPPSLPQDFEPNVELARKLVRSVVTQGRSWLDPIEVACLLRAYKIPITSATLAHTPEQAGLQAKSLLAAGTRVVVKVLSPDILYKSEVGGVRLGLTSPEAVEGAAAALMSEARAANPMARIEGVTVHPMIVRPKARELIVSIADDPTFGPVIVFGSGGTAVKVVGDLAVELPPLDLKLARDLVARTHVSRLLHAYGDVPSADLDAVALVLVKLAQLAADLPEIRELDLNPLLADENGVVALDARVSVRPVDMASTGRSGNPRFAIRAYPKEWERRGTLSDQTEIFIRPIRPEDQPLYARFFAGVTPEDIRLRFFGPIREFSHSFTARFTQIDYARAMAFIALHQDSGELLGVTRLHADSSYDTAEYAILVRSDYKGRGLGSKLMAILLEYARSEGLRVITGQVLATNTTMLRMCTALGFSVARHCEDGDVCVVSLTLDQKGPQPCRDARSSPANMT